MKSITGRLPDKVIYWKVTAPKLPERSENLKQNHRHAETCFMTQMTPQSNGGETIFVINGQSQLAIHNGEKKIQECGNLKGNIKRCTPPQKRCTPKL